jgi:hypothetical protein
VLVNARHHATMKTKMQKAIGLDPASSARWFEGWKRKATLPAGAASAASLDAVPVARARTWHLTTGWRRHGLLDPTDVPS